MRSFLITVGSLFLTAGVLTNAYIHKRQFYPSVVYITKSSPSMAVLYLQALVLIVLLGKVMRQIFFNQLRSAELEHLIERSWYAVTETCLAFTVFRDDFSPRFVALFAILLFLKCFHWLGEDRIDYMERSPVITWLFHIRAVSLLTLLGFLDAFFVSHAYSNTLIKGPSVQLVFGFEYAILLTVVLHIFVKYILHTIDVQSENPWENKAVYLLYTELALGLVKCMLYVIFLAIMIKVHTFPLFVIRPMYLTIREFKKALHDVVMSRRAIRNMNTLYPDASAEDLASSDNVCIICREEMHTSCKKLPCNHIFHTSCLRSWFQRQQTCPTCRMDVLRQVPAGAGAAAAAARQQGQQQQQQQQPGVQQAQQPIPPQPQQFPGFLGGMPPGAGLFPPWMQAVPPQMPQRQPSTTDAPTAAATAPMPMWPPGPGFSPFMMAPPPLVLPPFAIPTLSHGMTGSMAPPPPPGTLGLTDEELRMMEGEERRSVEARIRCLQDINVLLTAALTQMQQYTTLTGGVPTPQPLVLGSGSTGPGAAANNVHSQSAGLATASNNPDHAYSFAVGSTRTVGNDNTKTSQGLGAIPKTSRQASANIDGSLIDHTSDSGRGSAGLEESVGNDTRMLGARPKETAVAGNDLPKASEATDVEDGLRQRRPANEP